MTSSLVSSEMCIRDRIRSPSRLPDNLVCVWNTSNTCPKYLSWPPGKCRFCLLYTSDAADDM
eukprot:4838445-Prorocentrum_lima.AAC.1